MKVQYLNTTKDNEFTKNWTRVLILENLDISVKNSSLKFELMKLNISFDKVKVMYGKDSKPKGIALLTISQEYLDKYISSTRNNSQVLQEEVIPLLNSIEVENKRFNARLPTQEESQQFLTKRKNSSGKVKKLVDLSHVEYLYFMDFELAVAGLNTYLPIEVGIVKVNRSDFSTVAHFHELIHPGKIEPQFLKTAQYAKAVHGLDFETNEGQCFKNSYSEIWKQIVQFLNWEKETPLLIAKDPHVENMSLQWLQNKANELNNESCPISLSRETVIDVTDLIMSHNNQITAEQSEQMLKTLHHFEGDENEKCFLHKQLSLHHHCALQDCYTIVRWMKHVLFQQPLPVSTKESELQSLLQELKLLHTDEPPQENPVSWE